MLSSHARFLFLTMVLAMLAAKPWPGAAQALPHRDDSIVICERLGKHHTYIYSAVVDKDRNILVTAGQDPALLIWHAFTDSKNRETTQINLDAPAKSVVVAKLRDGATVVASGDLRNDIRLWDPVAVKPIAAWKAHERAEFYGLAHSTNARVLVSSASDQMVRFWDLESRKEISSLKVGLIDSMAFSHDGKLVALANQGGELHVLAYPSLKMLWKRNEGRHSTGHSVDFAPDGKTIATPEDGAGPHPWIQLWNAQSGASLGRIAVHPYQKQEASFREPRPSTNGIRFAKYSPTGLLVASGGYDGKVFVCEVATKQVLAVIPLTRGGLSGLSSIVFHDGDDRFVATSLDAEVFLCDLARIKKPHRQPEGRNLRAKLEACWDDLQCGDTSKAVVAVEFFLQERKEGPAFLRECTRNERKPSQASLAKSIEELASAALSVRERASKNLEKNLYAAEALLKDALKNPKHLEQRRRIEGLLEKIPTLDGLRPTELRPLRVISILNRIPGEESRNLLTWMSDEAESTLVKSEAKRALQNLGTK